jgi:hypothetical protein
MAEKKKLTLLVFQQELRDNFNLWQGEFNEEKFEALLDHYNFETHIIGRESLRIQLRRLGFFLKGKMCTSSFARFSELLKLYKYCQKVCLHLSLSMF